jgi:CSLREA domain-containing protein
MRRLAIATAVSFGLAALPAQAIITRTFTVNTTTDAVDVNPGDGICAIAAEVGPCSLRAAIMEANHQTGGLTKIVIPAGTYTLTIPPLGGDDETTGDLNITRATTIEGAGAATTILDGNASDRVFLVANVAVAMSGLTIRNGVATSSGGGIALGGLSAALTATNCTITANTAASGGGINVGFGNLILVGSTISGNHSTSTSAANGGGGIIQVNTGSAVIIDSTISGNTARMDGGGIWGKDGVSLFNVTVTGNIADSEHDGIGVGGGLYGDVSQTFVDSIIAGNFAGAAADDCGGHLTSNGFSIMQTVNSAHCTITGTVSGADPKLGPLQNNAGPTFTHALLSGSPAIDAGDPTGCKDQSAAILTVDQRGAHRSEGVACDLGAYERNANGDVNGDGVRDVSDIFALINFLFAGGPAPNGLGDVNGDGKTDINDVFALINFLFAGGPAPL